MKHPLANKSGQGRSKPLSPESLINMYAEEAPGFAKATYWLHSTPGTIPFVDLGTGFIRGMYHLQTDDSLFVVHGTSLYKITSAGVASNKGEIAGSGRVGMADNENELCITIGAKGYVYDNDDDTLTEILDSDWPRSQHVTFMDGFFVFADTTANGQFFISALLDGLTYDGLDFATAERFSDDLIRPYAHYSDLILFGDNSTEIWYNSGNSDFPFEPVSGGELDIGLGAHWSVQSVDSAVIWVDQHGIVRRKASGSFDAIRISTHAIEYQIAQGPWRTEGTNEGANSYTYIEEGHWFYVLSVPDTITVVYDAATGLWHQRKSQIQTQKYNVLKTQFYAFAHNVHYVGSAYNGKIYKSDIDYASESGEEIISIIQCPQLFEENRRFIVNKVELDLEWGVGLGAGEAFKLYNQNQGGDVCNINGTWSTQTSANDKGWNGITYGDKFVAVANDTSDAVMYSSTGTSWTGSNLPATDVQIASAALDADTLDLAISPGGGHLAQTVPQSGPQAGKKLYVHINDAGPRYIKEYTLTSAWDLETASLTNTIVKTAPSVVTSVQGSGIAIASDGTCIFIVSQDAGAPLEYNIVKVPLVTPYDLSTWTDTGSQTFRTGLNSEVRHIHVNEDGTNIYATYSNGSSVNQVRRYEMSTAYDLDTMSLGETFADSFTVFPNFICLTTDEKWMFTSQAAIGTLWKLGTAGDMSTATSYGTYNFTTTRYSAICNSDFSIFLTDNNVNGDTVYRYDVPLGYMRAYDVAWDGTDTYVAVGQDGGAYSSDGISWSISNLSENNVWEGVCWHPGISRWVAVASSGTDDLMASSPDGITWTAQTDGDIVGCNSVAASSTKLVAVGDGGVIVSATTTAATWDAGTAAITTETEAENNTWRDVVYSTEKMLFVAVASTGTNRVMWTSGNGSWFISDTSGASNASNQWRGITYGAGYFVTVSDSGTGNRIMRSASGKDAWQAVISPADNGWNEVAWSGETLCLMAAVSDSGTGDRVMISESTGTSSQAGTITSEAQTWVDAVVDPMVMLDVSGNTKTFDMTQPWRSMGKKGEFEKRIIWRRLGQHRSFTPKFAISAPVRKAIFGVYLDIEPCDG